MSVSRAFPRAEEIVKGRNPFTQHSLGRRFEMLCVQYSPRHGLFDRQGLPSIHEKRNCKHAVFAICMCRLVARSLRLHYRCLYARLITYCGPTGHVRPTT